MKDYPILDIDVHLAASKNRQYRETTYAYYKAIANFLQVKGLLFYPLLKEGESPAEGFKIMRSNLTDEGFALIQKVLDKWLTSISVGKIQPDDVRMLEEALLKISG